MVMKIWLLVAFSLILGCSLDNESESSESVRNAESTTISNSNDLTVNDHAGQEDIKKPDEDEIDRRATESRYKKSEKIAW